MNCADSAASLEETVETIARFADSIDVVGIPRLPRDVTSHPGFDRLAAIL